MIPIYDLTPYQAMNSVARESEYISWRPKRAALSRVLASDVVLGSPRNYAKRPKNLESAASEGLV